MRRNRKKYRNDGFMCRATPFAGVIVLLAVLGLGYASLKCRCQALGRDIQAREKDQAVLEQRRQLEECKWSQMKSPGNLQAALKKHGIVMIRPNPGGGQIIRMKETEVYGERWDALTGESRQFAHLERSLDNE
jgi:hypothetical protein